jgi:hypothetical protein
MISSGVYWTAFLVFTFPILAGCAQSAVPRGGDARVLAAAELELVTVGSAGATADVSARALPPAAQVAASIKTVAISGNAPIVAAPFLGNPTLNFASSELAVSATSGTLAEAAGTSHISISGSNGGAQVDVNAMGTAAGGTAGQAQLTMKFYGLSTTREDIVFGTAIATACCAPALEAEVTANGVAGGPHSAELQAHPRSDTAGEVQRQVDIAVVSSALPIINPGLAMVLLTSR